MSQPPSHLDSFNTDSPAGGYSRKTCHPPPTLWLSFSFSYFFFYFSLTFIFILFPTFTVPLHVSLCSSHLLPDLLSSPVQGRLQTCIHPHPHPHPTLTYVLPQKIVSTHPHQPTLTPLNKHKPSYIYPPIPTPTYIHPPIPTPTYKQLPTPGPALTPLHTLSHVSQRQGKCASTAAGVSRRREAVMAETENGSHNIR